MLMATGDYHHTAVAVARGVGMVPLNSHVIIIQTEDDIMSSNLPQAASQEAGGTWAPGTQKAQDPDLQPNAFQMLPHLLSRAMPSSLSDLSVLEQRQISGQNISLAEIGATADAQDSEVHASYLLQDPEQQPYTMPLLHKRQAVRSSQHQGLVFQVQEGHATQDGALQALTAIAQVNTLFTPTLIRIFAAGTSPCQCSVSAACALWAGVAHMLPWICFCELCAAPCDTAVSQSAP